MILIVISLLSIKANPQAKKAFNINGIEFNMILVEGGKYNMGGTSEEQDEAFENSKPSHEVTLHSYFIGETEVTQGLFKAIMPEDYAKYTKERDAMNSIDSIGIVVQDQFGDNYPMYFYSWGKYKQFIDKLNALSGMHFRFPTEAEWEFAARGGNKSIGYIYSGSNNIDEIAWYKNNSGRLVHEVATKKSNELGLYDMSGNVFELCNDWYDENYYKESPINNPQGPISGEEKVARGGSYMHNDEVCRNSFLRLHISDTPNTTFMYIGMRLALDAEQ